MSPVVRNILAVIGGVLIGGCLNMGIIMISNFVIPFPEGADFKSMEGLQASMHLMEPKHFIMPFLAHALGSLLGAVVGAGIAITHKMWIALGISAWFLIGGIMAVMDLPSPIWFTILDLTLAYIPMGYLGGKIMTSRRTPS